MKGELLPKKFRVPLAVSVLAVSLAACATASNTGEPAAADNPYGPYLSARLAEQEHDLADAAALYRQSLALDPHNTEILDKALFYSAVSGDLETTAALARQMIADEPDSRAARLVLAVDAFKHARYAEAHEHAAKSAKGPYEGLTLLLLDAWADVGEGKIDDALAVLKGVPGEGGTETLVSFQSALILDYADRTAAADQAYRATLAAGASPRAAEAYGRFLERNRRGPEARALYKSLLADAGMAPIAAKGLARLDAGIVPDRLVASPADGAAESLFGIAASLGDQSAAEIAMLYLQLTLALEQKFDLAKVILADRYETFGKFDEAIAVYRNITPDSPYRDDADVQIAIDENRNKQTTQAIADLVAITAAKPNDGGAWASLGDIYRSADNYAAATEAYDHAVKLLNPPTKGDWSLFFSRAAAEQQSGHWNLAEADLEMALKLSPDQSQVLNFLGYSWVDRGEHLGEALIMLEKARALSPYDGFIIDSVGWAYYRLGRYSDAAKTLEAAVLLEPGDPTINEHLGDAYWRIGRKLDARFQWSHALAFGPEAADKPKLEKKLRDGLDSGGDPA